MAGHWLEDNLLFVLPKTLFLYPSDEVTTVLCTEDIHRHDHHPHSKGGWHDEIFRLGYYLTVLYLWWNTISPGIVKEEKLYPTSPEKQSTNEPPEGLSGVSLDEYTNDYHY